MPYNRATYGVVIAIVRNYVIESDWILNSWVGKQKGIKIGDELPPHITIKKILNADLTVPNKKGQVSFYVKDKAYAKIDREFILKMFRKLNDTVAMVQMLKERGEL